MFLSNNWYSLSHNKTGIKENNALMLDPQFYRPGKATITDPHQLNSFISYTVLENSLLCTVGIDLEHKFGIKAGGYDFNQKIAQKKGIGACQFQ
jgi:hypothetical protein